MIGRLPRGWGAAEVLALYIPLCIAGDIASTYYAGGNGYSVWFVNSAFDVLLFLTLGWRYWPMPFLILIVGFLIAPNGRWGDVWINLATEIPYVLFLVLATQLCVRPLRVKFPLRNMRDVWVFAIVLGVAGPLLANASSLALFSLLDPQLAPWNQFLTQTIRGFGADITSIVLIVPAVTQILFWRTPLVAEGEERGIRIDREFLVGLIVTAIVVFCDYAVGARIGRNLAEFAFLPVAWLAIRFGMRGAVLAALVADIIATAMHVALRIPIEAQLEYQGYLVVTAVLAFLLGAFATERQALVGRLERAAYVDALTNLPTAERLLDFLRKANAARVALAIVDVADLRMLNEGLGRDAVDRLLLEFAARLRRGLPGSYFVARTGSGEFAVATLSDTGPEEVITTVAALLVAPFAIADSYVFVEASVGATSSTEPNDPGELLRRAEIAAGRAKISPGRTAIYGETATVGAAPLPIVQLHHAAEHREFVPFYQPIYRYTGSRWDLAGAELLMRWQHPERGLLAPGDFIDLLERLTISNSVGWGLLEEGLRQAMHWRNRIPGFTIWVNFFPRQVLDPHCATRIRRALHETNAVPQALVVEITERVVAGDVETIATLADELRSLGVSTAIDDFGTGGSSLARLREVPVQILKIDKSFVNRSDVDAKAMSVASTVVRLAADLNLSVVAEGIESNSQAQSMLGIGCIYGQGYALGHPAPADLFEGALLKSTAAIMTYG